MNNLLQVNQFILNRCTLANPKVMSLMGNGLSYREAVKHMLMINFTHSHRRDVMFTMDNTLQQLENNND